MDRPALAATIPTPNRPAVLLDVGASVECRPPHLLQFAVMGNELTRESHRLLKASLPSFIGNALKISEGLVEMIECLLSRELSNTIADIASAAVPHQ